MTGKTGYIAMVLHRWDGCELNNMPPGIFGGLNDGSVGFMPVFDDLEKLKAAYPDVEVTYIERDDDELDV